jgi:hypothetical protein
MQLLASESKMGMVPHFLKASSPELLQAAMLENNLSMKSQVKYQDINQLKDGSFICWYYKEIDIYALIKPKGK